MSKRANRDKYNRKRKACAKAKEREKAQYGEIEEPSFRAHYRHTREERKNDIEQDELRNSIRILGLSPDREEENDEETLKVVIGFFNQQLKLPLKAAAIVNAQRFGTFRLEKIRPVVVRLVKFHTKTKILKQNKEHWRLNTGATIFEELTKLNNDVLSSVRLKAKHLVDRSWSRDGHLFVQYKDGSKEKIAFTEYSKWLDLPWPSEKKYNRSVTSMPKFKAPEQAKCPLCKKAVYAAEERLAGGEKWHKFCFKCSLCGKLLDSMTCAEHQGLLYCKMCHGKKFGPKGVGFGGGAGALSMETGDQFGNADSEMGNRPREAHIGGSVGGPNACGRCGRTVYEMEKANGMSDPWHKVCCCCKICKKKLDPTALNRHEHEIYCKGCYGKNFGTSGYGFGIGAGCLSTGT